MKKIYTSILAALCVFGASAGNLQLKTLAPIPAKANETKAVATMVKVDDVKSSNIKFKAGESKDIAGEYDVVIGDYYFKESTGEKKASAEIVNNGNGTISITCSEFSSSVTANYDEATGEITFPSVKLGSLDIQGTTYYIKFFPTQYTYDATTEKGSIGEYSYTATYNSETGSIAFPKGCGFGWGAYTSALYTSQAGWIGLFDMLSMTKKASEPIDEVQEGQWKTIGNATLEDAWITPSYSATATQQQFIPSENPITAELQQNVNNANLYRLWRPFHDTNWALVSNNLSEFEGQIVFDVSDPEHVIVKAGMPAGFKNDNGEFYVYGILGWRVFNNPETDLQAIINFMAENGDPFDTFADGVVTINKSIFDINKNCTKAYTWQNNTYVVSKITFPKDPSAIGSVSSDAADENAPVEYFNLQGIKVENPAQGQIVIRRQGSKVSKVYVK